VMGGGVLDHGRYIYPVFSDLIKGGMMFIVATLPFSPKRCIGKLKSKGEGAER
jgi:hypothetical protein